MGSFWFSNQSVIRNLLLLFICLLCLFLLSDSSPLRKRRNKTSVGHTALADNGHRVSLLNKSSNVGGKKQQSDAEVLRHAKPVLGQVNETAQQDAADVDRQPVLAMPLDHVKKDDAAGSSPVPDEKMDADGEGVGQLPGQLVIPGPPQTNLTFNSENTISQKGVKPLHNDQEQGIVVGVGAMNRELSTTPKSQKAFHQGPDNSLDIGAADRKISANNSKAFSHNVAADSNLNAAHGAAGEDPLSVNPALQQPPPQVREPPFNQIHDKETHLGPVKIQQGALMSGPPDSHVGQGQNKPYALNRLDEKIDVLKFDRNVIDLVKEPVKMAELNPPDHMEGIRMEKDGHLNRDYKKEIFLGHHEEFEWSDEEKVSGKLKIIFRRADKNNNGFLEVSEIQDWITKNVKVHLDDAVQDNNKVFRHLDADKDGYVSWAEFYSHFLVAKGYVLSARDVKDNLSLEVDDNERIVKYRYRWSDADENHDNKLDIDEMMNFRHPEQSKRTILQLVKDMIDNVDKDGDGIVAEEEFVALPHDLDGQEPLPMEEDWQEERRKEFRNVIDRNKDGKADTDELKNYFDPHNVNHAKLEAENLIKMADANDDGKLSIDEILDNTELFVGSKMVDAKKRLHDEF